MADSQEIQEEQENRITALWDKLLRFAIFSCHQKREDAEDLVEETFAAVYETFKKEPERIKDLPDQYFVVALRRKSTNLFLTARKKYETTLEDIELLPEDDLELIERIIREEERKRMRQMIKTLTEYQQKVVEMFYLRGMRIAQIADELGTSQTAISSTLNRARNDLRKKMEKEGGWR